MIRALITYLSLLFLCLTISACSSAIPYYSYHLASPPAYVVHPKVIPIWLDARFTPSQIESIKAAIIEWNLVLNGQMQLDLQQHHLLGADKQQHLYPLTFKSYHQGLGWQSAAEKAGQGWVIYSLFETDPETA